MYSPFVKMFLGFKSCVKGKFLLLIFLLRGVAGFAQNFGEYPQGYFRWPLDLQPEIVANMGELRNNHWHMGLDMRTQQVVNKRVYAAADGYVARVGIKPHGYGKFMVINHPNGLSTLYAHLNEFYPALQQYVIGQQTKQESWALDLVLARGQFPLLQGSYIALSGTTGGSQGPHLHFEIYDTKTTKRLNPLRFGMPLTDEVSPAITQLVLYNREKTTYPAEKIFYATKKTLGSYTIQNNKPIITGFKKVSFGIRAFDQISGSGNKDGIYGAKIFLDSVLLTEFVIDSIDYTETRLMNAHIDYSYKIHAGSYLQHLSKLPGSHCPTYRKGLSDGTFELNDTLPHNIRIEAWDAYENMSELNFQIQFAEYLYKPHQGPAPMQWQPAKADSIIRPNFKAFIPHNVLYDTANVYYFFTPGYSYWAMSSSHKIADESIPLNDAITIKIKPEKQIPDWLSNKIVMAREDRSQEVAAATKEGAYYTAAFKDFGAYQLLLDTVPPTINSLGDKDTIDLSGKEAIIFTPKDNNEVKSFRAELDGRWMCFSNDKGSKWIYLFDEQCPDGVHHLKVTVTDIADNATVDEWVFKKYPYVKPVKKKPVKKTPIRKRKKR